MLPAVDEDFGIGMVGGKAVARGNQFLAELRVIVYFAIEDDMNGAVFIGHGLEATWEIDNGEAAVNQRGGGVRARINEETGDHPGPRWARAADIESRAAVSAGFFCQGVGALPGNLMMPAIPHIRASRVSRPGNAGDGGGGKSGLERFVVHRDIQCEFTADERGQFLPEALKMPAGHERMTVEGFVTVNKAGEGGNFALAGDQRRRDALSQANDLCGDP